MPSPSENVTILKFVKHSATAKCPTYGSAGAAGMDVYADEATEIWPGKRKLVATNISMAVPPGFVAQMCPRSGLALKHGITLTNSPGIIDSDYRGAFSVMVQNLGNEVFNLAAGDRIAQIIIMPYERVALLEVAYLDKTERGAGSFGSTGSR